MIVEITYGHCVVSSDDKYISLAERATTVTLQSGDAGGMLVDFFPTCIHVHQMRLDLGSLMCIVSAVLAGVVSWRWVQEESNRRQKDCSRAFRYPLRDGQAGNGTSYYLRPSWLSHFVWQIDGVARPCFTTSLLEETLQAGALKREDEHEIKGAAGLLYGGRLSRLSMPSIRILISFCSCHGHSEVSARHAMLMEFEHMIPSDNGCPYVLHARDGPASRSVTKGPRRA